MVVHGGVGIYGDDVSARALDGLREASSRGRDILEGGGTALRAVLEAVRTLEDNPGFNAGTGSALTSDGQPTSFTTPPPHSVARPPNPSRGLTTPGGSQHPQREGEAGQAQGSGVGSH